MDFRLHGNDTEGCGNIDVIPAKAGIQKPYLALSNYSDMKIYHYDAFSRQPNKGNPAGVVFEADLLSEQEMQEIAAAVGFNETAFICSSDKADLQLRYFTPGHEMNLCGHGTVAALVALYERHGLKNINRVETKAGIINAKIERLNDGQAEVVMKQLPAQFIDFHGDVAKLAAMLGIDERDMASHLPPVYGNTGIWTLLVPIESLQSFKKMAPHTKNFPDVLSQFPRSSIHPFCLETYHPDSAMHGRHFSSPYSGTVEDPITGTASGVMGAYYLKYISKTDSVSLQVEQGQEIGKDGIVKVKTMKTSDGIEVEIAGTATFVTVLNV